MFKDETRKNWDETEKIMAEINLIDGNNTSNFGDCIF